MILPDFDRTIRAYVRSLDAERWKLSVNTCSKYVFPVEAGCQ